MGGGDGGRSADGSRRPAPAGRRIAPSTWFAVAVIGILVFVVGIWKPAWAGVANGVYVSYLFAILGGILFIVGLSFGYDALPAKRRRSSIEGLPGVEVFQPGPASSASGRPSGAPGDEPAEPPVSGGGSP